MDSARAKTIIILLLLSFNIFLLVYIFTYAQGQGIPKETVRNSEAILASRGVTLDIAMPGYWRDTPKLRYGNDLHDQSLLAVKLLGLSSGKDYDSLENGGKKLVFHKEDGSNGVMEYTDRSPSGAVDITRAKSADSYVRAFLKETGLIDSSFVLDSTAKNADGSLDMEYLEKYKGYFVFDNYLSVTLTDKGITRLESKRRKITGFSKDKVKNISAAYQILLGNFRSPEKLTITGMDFGYKSVGSQESVSSEQLPVWRVKIKGQPSPRYFSAADGRELT